MKILIIEDDRAVGKSLKSALNKDYAIELVYSGRKGSFKALTNEYDLIILDLNLPDISGLEVCQDLRRENMQTPILVLTGKSLTESKIVLLNAGADDYLTKPFSLSELKARIRALLRRGKKLETKIIVADKLSLNPTSKTTYYKNKPIKLSKKEFLLLYYLMRQPNVPQTRIKLFEHIWDSSPYLTTNTVDVHICNLRRKLNQLATKNLIKTVHGLGYMLSTPMKDCKIKSTKTKSGKK